MDHLKLAADKLTVDDISELVVNESCGAVSIFVGTTRDNFEGKKVLRLEYEAYEPMALKAMKSICDEARSKWPAVHGIAIYHRRRNTQIAIYTAVHYHENIIKDYFNEERHLKCTNIIGSDVTGLGAVPCCEASVVIAVSSPHRRDSLDAVSYCIDTLKASVPIWKKEVYADSEPVWKENIECAWSKQSQKV